MKTKKDEEKGNEEDTKKQKKGKVATRERERERVHNNTDIPGYNNSSISSEHLQRTSWLKGARAARGPDCQGQRSVAPEDAPEWARSLRPRCGQDWTQDAWTAPGDMKGSRAS